MWEEAVNACCVRGGEEGKGREGKEVSLGQRNQYEAKAV